MTTSANPLADQLTQARDRVAVAERDLGGAALDGKGVDQRQKALDDARAEVERLELAEREEKQRLADAEEQRQAEAAQSTRAAFYRGTIPWLEALNTFSAAARELERVESEFRSTPTPPHVHALKHHALTLSDKRLARFDAPFLRSLPRPPANASSEIRPVDPDRCSELIARATELAEAEEAGEAEAIVVTPATHAAKARERARIRREGARRKRERSGHPDAERVESPPASRNITSRDLPGFPAR